ncbi:MAG: 5'-nucleotidase C-terminal domain-containing protein [Leptospiraceae bacterium]|nr:5'-nucleotidase C-terminal domain-containing protein [Leptospiraceae bacterium]
MKTWRIKSIGLIFFVNFVWSLWAEHIIFVHTNDSHGYFYPRKEKDKEIYGPLALYAHLAAIRIEAAQKKAFVILTHGGDINTGTPESDLVYAKPDIEIMNHLGFTVTTLGNHEFDIPRRELERQMEQSYFRWLAANIEKKNGERLAAPVLLLELGRIRLGILGLITQSTEKISVPQNIRDLIFEDPVRIARYYTEELRKKADMVVVLSHLGFYPAEKEQQLKYKGDIAIAKNVRGIDLILGGHSHSLVINENIEGVPIYQADSYYRYAVRVDFEVNPGEKPRLLSHRVLSLAEFPVEWAKIKELDPYRTEYRRLEEIIQNALKTSEKLFSRVIAQSEDDFLHDRTTLFHQSVPIGNLIADAQRQFTQADIGIVNSGGIRAGLDKGPILLREVYTICPFRNTVGTIELKGSEIRELFRLLLMRKENGHFPQISGAEVHFNRDNHTVRVYLRKDGTYVPIKSNQVYKVSLNSYLAAGGNDYPDIVTKSRFHDTGMKDSEILQKFLEQRGVVRSQDFAEKRIRFFRLRRP